MNAGEKRPRWGVRSSKPGGAVSRSLVGSTPILSRQFTPARTVRARKAGFLGAFLGTTLSPRDPAAEHKFTELEVRANTGLGAEKS